MIKGHTAPLKDIFFKFSFAGIRLSCIAFKREFAATSPDAQVSGLREKIT